MEEQMSIERFKRKTKAEELDGRISAVLGNGATIGDALVHDIAQGIAEADALAQAERTRSLDPMTTDAEAAAQRASIAELRRDRLQAALPRIEERVAARERSAALAQWTSDADQVEQWVEAAAKKLATTYAELALRLSAALREASAANVEADQINGAAPDGVDRRIAKVDLGFTKNLVLPDFDHPRRNLWPPRSSVAESYAAMVGMATDPRAYSSEWWKAKQESEPLIRAQQQRQADDYARMTREQEERQNREERERFAQSQRRQ
jgi:hypothetical protein